MSKDPPVRTRCPHCHKFHYAWGKTPKSSIAQLAGLIVVRDLMKGKSIGWKDGKLSLGIDEDDNGCNEGEDKELP